VPAWDPEGLLSTLPAIGTCLLGVFAGLLLKEPSLQPHQKTLWLIGAGAAMIALGVLWGLQFPIVKNIWTSSYVLVCGGLSALLLGVFHQVIDAWERRSWAMIFIWIGASAITLYLQRHRGLHAARNVADRRRRGQLCGQPSDARRGELSRPCRGAAASGGAGRLPIPPQDLSACVICAGSCLIVFGRFVV
jgi:hypothetical protein